MRVSEQAKSFTLFVSSLTSSSNTKSGSLDDPFIDLRDAFLAA